jgi:integrase
MSLADRQPVPGTTNPVVYIKHRIYNGRNGSKRASKQWVAEYCTDSKQKHVKLDTTNKTAAIKKAHELHRKIMSNEIVAPKKVEIAGLVDQYMTYQHGHHRAPKTIEKYEFVLRKQFVPWCKDNQKVFADRFTPQDFWAYSKWLADKGKSRKTIHDRQTIIKQVFKWGTRRAKLLVVDPLSGETLSDPPVKKQPCFEPEQVSILLEKADPHEKVIFATLAYTGMRFGEVQQLRWSCVTLDDKGGGIITIERGGSGDTTKGKEARYVPIHKDLRTLLDTLPRTHEWVFTARPSAKHPEGGGMISERRLLLSLKRLCKRCGFPNPNQYKVHTFRHVFASMLARSNEGYKTALQLVGHKNSRIFDIYYKMYAEDAKKSINTVNYPVLSV